MSPAPDVPPPPAATGPGSRVATPVAAALAAALAVGGLLGVMALAVLGTDPDPVLLALSAGPQQAQGVKSGLYVLAFAVLLPAAAVLVPVALDRLARVPGRRAALPALGGLVAAGLVAALLATKASAGLPWGDGLRTLLVALLLWLAGTATLAGLVLRGPAGTAERIAGLARPAWLAAVALGLGALLAVASPWPRSLAAIAVGAGAGWVVHWAHERRAPGGRAIGRRAGRSLDVLVVVVVLLAVPDLVVWTSTGAPVSSYVPPGVYQFHHDFLLGPAAAVLGGGVPLVDAPVSQYGVGTTYAIAGWSALLGGAGYGALALLDGILTALVHAAGYALLRAAGVGRALAAAALGVAVVGLVYRYQYPVGGIPQQGPLRFGPPVAVVVPFVLAARFPAHARPLRALALLALGLASAWAFEALVYSAVAFGALVLAEARMAPSRRVRLLVRRVVQAALACVAVQVVLLVGTVLASGSPPDWGQYLAYVRAFLLGGEAGRIVFGFEPWSPALALGAGVLTSAAAVGVLLVREPARAARERAAVTALVGTTAVAIAMLSYTANRSSNYLVPYVALPSLLAGATWLSLVLRRRAALPAAARRGALVLAGAVAVLLVVLALPSARERFPDTALAKARPGGGALEALDRLRDPPPVDPRAPQGERLLARGGPPGDGAVPVLLPSAPDLGLEVLLRTGRDNALPLGNPIASSFVPVVSADLLRPAIAGLRPGTRMLTDRAGLLLLRAGRRDPRRARVPAERLDSRTFQPWVMAELGRRFVARPVATSGPFVLVALERPR